MTTQIDDRDYTAMFQEDKDITHFNERPIPHHAFVTCERVLMSRIAQADAKKIVCVLGPSGAGKTALLKEACRHLSRVGTNIPEAQLKEEAASGRRPYLPYIHVLAKTGRDHDSRMRNLLKEILRQSNTILWQIGSTHKPSRAQEKITQAIDLVSIPALQELVFASVKERRVRAILIDEAQHLTQRTSDEVLSQLADTLKLLGSQSNTVLVLFGAADLYRLPKLNAQYGRRTAVINFCRYDHKDSADLAAFGRVLKSMHEKLPKILPVDLLNKHQRDLFAGSCGCVGTLHGWLVEAIRAAKANGSSCVSSKNLMDTQPAMQLVERILAESQKCEEGYREMRKNQDKLTELFWPPKKNTGPAGPKTSPSKKKNKPFERSPHYDPAGTKTKG